MNRSEARTLVEGGNLSESALKEVLELYGIRVPRGILTRSVPDTLNISFPVVLKVSDPDILHKSDVGGVKTGISGPDDLKSEFGAMSAKFPGKELLIEEMIRPGLEAIVGVMKDRSLGQAIMLGMGGIYTELYRDVSFRLLPIDRNDAEEMIESVGVGRFVGGFRGVKISKEKLVELLINISGMVMEIGENIDQLDLNPVILGENDAVAADAKLISGGRK